MPRCEDYPCCGHGENGCPQPYSKPKPNCSGPTGYHCSCWYAGLYCHFCDADRSTKYHDNRTMTPRGPHPIFTQEYLDAHIAARRKTAKK